MSYFRTQQAQSGSNPYEFSPLGNQIFSNNANSTAPLNGNNGYIYNNNQSTNSPISSNDLLNNQSSNNGANGSNFNNLNLSTRATTSNQNNGTNATSNLSLHQNSNVYPTPRLNNISPSLNFASLYSNRARFNASKGFDAEDDLEFCPEIHEQYQTHSSSSNSSFTHHKFNPYTASTFSPQVSPTSANASTASPSVSKASIANTTPKSDYSSAPRTLTPRAKKVLEIVNPITGLRVTSPAPYK